MDENIGRTRKCETIFPAFPRKKLRADSGNAGKNPLIDDDDDFEPPRFLRSPTKTIILTPKSPVKNSQPKATSESYRNTENALKHSISTSEEPVRATNSIDFSGKLPTSSPSKLSSPSISSPKTKTDGVTSSPTPSPTAKKSPSTKQLDLSSFFTGVKPIDPEQLKKNKKVKRDTEKAYEWDEVAIQRIPENVKRSWAKTIQPFQILEPEKACRYLHGTLKSIDINRLGPVEAILLDPPWRLNNSGDRGTVVPEDLVWCCQTTSYV
eukprot:TRINITY_DN11904_c0_g1_i1.p1 TRINITY_DN11904_c0_g1~~TRINITY_DN11904_c0_g1_i1.p1  ORF type:complete len:266 (-),score=26.58 TRINITY_DN11904_c0_g1_i1:6-803(-)